MTVMLQFQLIEKYTYFSDGTVIKIT